MGAENEKNLEAYRESAKKVIAELVGMGKKYAGVGEGSTFAKSITFAEDQETPAFISITDPKVEEALTIMLQTYGVQINSVRDPDRKKLPIMFL